MVTQVAKDEQLTKLTASAEAKVSEVKEEVLLRPPFNTVVGGIRFFGEKPCKMGVRVKWGLHKCRVMGGCGVILAKICIK